MSLLPEPIDMRRRLFLRQVASENATTLPAQSGRLCVYHNLLSATTLYFLASLHDLADICGRQLGRSLHQDSTRPADPATQIAILHPGRQ